jgi:hypothetical protein
MRFCRVVVLVLIVWVACSGVAQATSLADLLQGGTVSAGDKTFGNFSFVCLTGNCAAEGITPANITVLPSFVDGTGYLEFGGDMISASAVDFLLRYSVSASAGLIDMIDQSFNLSNGGTGGTIVIGEDVRLGSFQGQIVANSSISFVFNGGSDLQDPIAEQGDDLIVNPPQTIVFVTKDVNLSPNAGGIVGTSLLTQSFHQIPEPTSLILLGAGLMGLGIWRRRSA